MKALEIDGLKALCAMKWLTLREACVYSRLSENTLKELLKKGLVYGKLTGGKWIIDRESIDDYYNTDRVFEKLNINRIKCRLERTPDPPSKERKKPRWPE